VVLRRAFAVVVAIALTVQPAFAQMVVNGTAADQAKFNALLERCAGQSKSLHKLIDDLMNKPKPTVTIDLVHAGADGTIDTAGLGKGAGDAGKPPGTSTINLDNFDKLPDGTLVKVPPPSLTMPPGVPPWALTKCELLAHILAEAQAGANGAPFGTAHKRGIAAQNDFRSDVHQKPGVRTQTNEAGGYILILFYGESEAEKLTFPGGSLEPDYRRGKSGPAWTPPPKPK
jgi:hypothetical protein